MKTPPDNAITAAAQARDRTDRNRQPAEDPAAFSARQRLRVEYWPAERLKPYERNPRKNDQAVDRMLASIAEFGFAVPVLARSTGEVVDGHLRLKAAVKLAMAEVPVIPCDGWTDTQVKAFRLMVNRSVTWADWDEDLLALELQEIREADFDLGLAGFEDEELARLLAAQDSTPGLVDEDAAPELPETPVSVSGDLWILGKHKLLVGDATNQSDVSKLMNGGSADLIFTDPPYNVDYEGYTNDRLKIQGDRMTDEQFGRSSALARNDQVCSPKMTHQSPQK